MKVELSEQAEHLVHQQIAGGRYHTAGEVIEDALRRLGDDNEYWAEVEQMVEQGRKSLAEGRMTPLTPGLADRIKMAARSDRLSRRPHSA